MKTAHLYKEILQSKLYKTGTRYHNCVRPVPCLTQYISAHDFDCKLLQSSTFIIKTALESLYKFDYIIFLFPNSINSFGWKNQFISLNV